MHPLKALLVLFPLLATGLAGCGGTTSTPGDCGEGFCILAPATAGGAYTFTASVTADNYTWDLGDNLGLVYGKQVEHTYDVVNAKLTPRLYAKTGTETHLYKQDGAVRLGTMVNAAATFLLEAQTNWAVTGERVRFSARSSHDPDGDAMRFAWACQRNKDAVRLVPHTHGALPPPFISPPAGSVTSGVANHTLPAPDRSFDAAQDFCAQLGTVGHQPLSRGDMTIEGTFAQQGLYSIFLIAADPAHPTVSGQFDFVVTPPADRPNATIQYPFEGDFIAGAGTATGQQNAQTACDAAMLGKTCDVYNGQFSMPLGASVSYVNFTYQAAPASGVPDAYQASWELLRGQDPVKSGGPAQGTTVVDGVLTPLPATYTMRVKADAGANFHFKVNVDAHMDLDPYKLYY